MIVTGFGLGLLLSPTNTDALGRVTPAERSQASGLLQTVRQLGGTLGLALVGTLVLGILSRPTTTQPEQHAANAMTAGFAVAAAAVLVALVAGYILLSRRRIEGAADTRALAKAG